MKKGATGDAHAAVVLMAGRHDVVAIRANGAACPSFARHLAAAAAEGGGGGGVRVLGHRVRWGEGVDAGKAFDGGQVPVLAPLTKDDLTVLVRKPRRPKKPRTPKMPLTTPQKDQKAATTPKKVKTENYESATS